ncbi:MAG: toxic anion resistance protein [Deinococcus sp.]|nr:toxic anion resistance protein [Deinococcus sp.]
MSDIPALDPETHGRLQAQAADMAAELIRHPHHSPEFRRQVAAVQAVGQQAQRRAAGLGRALSAPQTDHAQLLGELRQLLAGVQPAQPGLLARLLGRRPAAPTPQDYAQAAARSGPLLEQLYRTQDDLRRQQVALHAELRRLEDSQAELHRALTLTGELDRVLGARLPELEARQPLHAAVVREEALYSVRGRHTDLTVALAATAQARLALELARGQAAELEAQLERTTAGVVTALKLARSAAQAAHLRTAAAQAERQLRGAQQDMAQAVSPEELNAALAQAYAALDELGRLERQTRPAPPPSS